MRRLEADLTSSKRLAEERKTENARLQQSLESALALAKDRLDTVNKLEDDLDKLSSSLGGGGAGRLKRDSAGGGGEYNNNASPRGGAMGVFGSVIGNEDNTQALKELLGVGEDDGGGGGGSGGEGGGVGADRGVLGIVQVGEGAEGVDGAAECNRFVLFSGQSGEMVSLHLHPVCFW